MFTCYVSLLIKWSNRSKQEGFTKNKLLVLALEEYFLLILRVRDRLDHLISEEYDISASKKAMREKNINLKQFKAKTFISLLFLSTFIF